MEEDNMDEFPLLKRLRDTPDNLMPDDDHLDRPSIFTEEESSRLADELITYWKKYPFVKGKKRNL